MIVIALSAALPVAWTLILNNSGHADCRFALLLGWGLLPVGNVGAMILLINVSEAASSTNAAAANWIIGLLAFQIVLLFLFAWRSRDNLSASEQRRE